MKIKSYFLSFNPEVSKLRALAELILFSYSFSEGQHRRSACRVVEESDTLSQYEGTDRFSNNIGGKDHWDAGGREGRDARVGSGNERAGHESCCRHVGQTSGKCGICGWIVEDEQRDAGVASDSEQDQSGSDKAGLSGGSEVAGTS